MTRTTKRLGSKGPKYALHVALKSLWSRGNSDASGPHITTSIQIQDIHATSPSIGIRHYKDVTSESYQNGADTFLSHRAVHTEVDPPEESCADLYQLRYDLTHKFQYLCKPL